METLSVPVSYRAYQRSIQSKFSCKKVFRSSSARLTPCWSLCYKASVWNNTGKSNQQWKSHIFPRTWCGFSAKSTLILYTWLFTLCTKNFLCGFWMSSFIVSVHNFSFNRNYLIFFFCSIPSTFVSVLSLAVFWSKFFLSTYSPTSLPRPFHSAVNGGPV